MVVAVWWWGNAPKKIESGLHLTDRAFQGLPIPWVKKKVEELVSPTQKETNSETLSPQEIAVGKILSGENPIISEGKSGRYIDKSSWFYIYNLKLSDSTEIDVVFYSHANYKVLVKINENFVEVRDFANNNLLQQIASVFPLPVYTQDGIWGVRLVASL